MLREYKIKSVKNEKLTISVRKSEDVQQFIHDKYELIDGYEEFFAIYLNSANKVIGYMKISQGGTSQTVVDNKIIFKGVVDTLATGLILCHNHPGGNLCPSGEDKQITNKIKELCDLFGVRLLDHIISSGTEENHYSFCDNGLL